MVQFHRHPDCRCDVAPKGCIVHPPGHRGTELATLSAPRAQLEALACAGPRGVPPHG